MGPIYHPYMRPAQYSDTSRTTPNPAALAAAYELYDNAKITPLTVTLDHTYATAAPTTSVDPERTVPILNIFDDVFTIFPSAIEFELTIHYKQDTDRPRPLTLYEAYTSWTLVAASAMISTGWGKKIVHRPRLVDTLPGGSYEIEQFLGFRSAFLLRSVRSLLSSPLLPATTGDLFSTLNGSWSGPSTPPKASRPSGFLVSRK